MKKDFRIAFAQPRNLQRSWSSHWPIFFDETTPPERLQLEKTRSYIESAAESGAQLLVFPELYPGPQAPGEDAFTEAEADACISEAARASGIWVVANAKPLTEDGGTWNQARVFNPEGQCAGRYNKIIPASNEPNTPGSDPLIFDCNGLKVGVLICWEMWYPEIARTLRMLGADLIVAPTGGIVYELTDAWRTVLRARAYENNCYVGMTLNVFGVEDGLCEVNGPEGLVASRKGEGLLVADLDLERLRYMQETDERIIVPKPYRSVPGLLRWLRPSAVNNYAEAAKKSLDAHAHLRKS